MTNCKHKWRRLRPKELKLREDTKSIRIRLSVSRKKLTRGKLKLLNFSRRSRTQTFWSSKTRRKLNKREPKLRSSRLNSILSSNKPKSETTSLTKRGQDQTSNLRKTKDLSSKLNSLRANLKTMNNKF